MRRIAICFAPQDAKYLKRLESQLSRPEREKKISVWHRERITVGVEVAPAVNRGMEQADVLVLLISPDLIADWDEDVRRALKQRDRGAQIVPVLLRSTLLDQGLFHGLRMLPADSRPISQRADPDEAWVEVAQALLAVGGEPEDQPGGGPGAAPGRKPAQPAGDREQPLRLLFLGANPSDSTKLALDKEVKEIGARIDYAQQRHRFDLVQQWAVTVDELSQVMLRYKPNIAHFSGHGTEDGEIVLLDRQGQRAPVPQRALTRLFALFKSKGLRCVVLNACYADSQAQAISEHIDCVVGIAGTISDESALAFTAGLYMGLSGGESIQDSFEFGCTQIDLLGLDETDVPRLFCRTGVDPTEMKLV